MAPVAMVIEPSYMALDEQEIPSSAELERRLLVLRSARRLLQIDGVIAVLTVEETSAALLKYGYYPFDGRLGKLLRRFGLQDIYTENDFRIIVQDIIGKSNSLEEFLEVSAVMYNDQRAVNPGCGEFYSNHRLLELFVEVLGVIAAAIVVRPDLGERVRVCCPASVSVREVEFCGRLEASEPDLGYSGEVQQGIRIADRYQDFILSLDGWALWRTAENADDVVLALLVGAVKRGIASGNVRKVSDIPLFGVGSDFIESLGRNQAGGVGRFSSVTYDAAVGVLSGVGGRPMRLAKGGASPQRTRADGSIAWRSHITTSHEALRLMYWTGGGCIEFANVGVKNELFIAEGNGLAGSGGEYLAL